MADTGPLIALARTGRLDLLRRLYGRVAVPLAVEREMAIGSDRPGARVLEGALEAGWISVRAVGETGATQDIFMLLGQGEAEAISILAGSLNRDPELFAFLRSLESYQRIIRAQDTIILSSDSPLFDYLASPNPPANSGN